MLRRAGPQDGAQIDRLRQAPQNAMWIEPPEPGEIAAAIAAGFAVIMAWGPLVFGLTALDGHRIGFDVTTDNIRALRLYERLGFRREGHLRACWRRPDGHWSDCLLPGLLRREWQP